MKPEGVLFMLISWAVILGLFAYSMIRTLSHKHSDEPPDDHP
jgi:hypothetical protein